MSIFQKIIDGELPCEKVFENEKIFAFKDIAPIAPVHILIIPKKPLASLQAAQQEDAQLLGEILLAAAAIAQKLQLKEGYRVLTNIGRDSGQLVPHLHFHLIGGRKLGSIG